MVPNMRRDIMDKRKGLVTMHGDPMTLVGKEIKVGDKAPDFTVAKNDLSPYSLTDAGDKVKIISVVTSLDTGVCEVQTIRFNEQAEDLSFGQNYGFVLEELSLLSRGIVILDKDNTVKYVEYVKEVTDHPDYDKAIEEAKKLL